MSIATGPEEQDVLLAELTSGPLALHTDVANAQHYELPAEFFAEVLGRHLKYSSGYWPDGTQRLDDAELCFDRVVSIEMFEHMRNYPELLARIAAWLKPHGKLFVHIFCHHEKTYPFEVQGASDWMARHFFTGGLMPAAGLLPRFQEHLALEEAWLLSGEHYRLTAEAWLANMDRERESILPILRRVLCRALRLSRRPGVAPRPLLFRAPVRG